VTPAARGQGVATHASALLCAYGFERLGLTRVELLVDAGNVASLRVGERLGAVRDGQTVYQGAPMLRYSLSPSAATRSRNCRYVMPPPGG
jgi:RimJ/RimL family protein N-acetyltransferase